MQAERWLLWFARKREISEVRELTSDIPYGIQLIHNSSKSSRSKKPMQVETAEVPDLNAAQRGEGGLQSERCCVLAEETGMDCETNGE